MSILGDFSKKVGQTGQAGLGGLFGNRDNAGILGTGQFKTGTTAIDEGAFTDQTRSNERRAEMAEAMRKSALRKGAKMNTNQADQWRNRQEGLANNLDAQLRGDGPTVAGLQQKQGLNQALANANSMAASMRGVSPAMALKLTQQQQGMQAQQGVADASMLRAQEQMSAQQQMGGLLSNARGADLATAGANQAAEMQQRAANDQQERFYREGTLGIDERDRQAKMDLGKLRVNEGIGVGNINAGSYADAAARRGNIAGGIAQGISSVFSDKNLKENIQEVKSDSKGGFDPTVGGGEGDYKFASGHAGLGKAIGEMMAGGGMLKKLFGGGGGDGGGGMAGMLGGMGGMMGGGGAGAGAAGGAAAGGGGLLGGGAGAALAMSDEKAKEFIEPLTAYSYNYKEPEKFGEGRQIGVMAQDLEKSSEGKKMVSDTPEGKVVDYGKSGAMIVATQAMLNDRMNQMEKMLKRRSSRKGAA